jgi:RNA polymerase sigma-70 factor (ECF subfamily)
MTLFASLPVSRSGGAQSEAFTDEHRLVALAQAGDDTAFDALVHRHTVPLYGVVRRMVGDDGEAENIVQEAFLRVWSNLSRYRNDRPFFPYLVTVAANLARDHWCREQRLSEDDLEALADLLSDPGDLPDRLVENAETLRLLAEAVARLPEPYRAVIALRYDAGFSYEEIAVALGLPLNTVRTHLHRAKAQLRRQLEEQFR